jgi:hypothetical protein
MRLLVAFGILVVFSNPAAPQSSSELVGGWTCPNFTVTVQANGNSYLVHGTHDRGMGQVDLVGTFKDGQFSATHPGIGTIGYIFASKQLIFDGQRCSRR